MRHQLRGLNESTTAHVANEIPLLGVNPPMHCQSVGPLEALHANVTLVRSSVAVRH